MLSRSARSVTAHSNRMESVDWRQLLRLVNRSRDVDVKQFLEKKRAKSKQSTGGRSGAKIPKGRRTRADSVVVDPRTSGETFAG